jgi:hypothetical protein
MRCLLNTITTDLAKRGQLQTATNRSIIIVVEMQNSSVLFGAAMDKAFLYLAEVLRVQVQELFPTRPLGNRIYDFIEKLETTRF